MLGTNSRGFPASRGQTVREVGAFAEGFRAVGAAAPGMADSDAVTVGGAFLRPASPCFVQYRRKVSYEAGNGGDALRYASHTRHIV